MFRVLIVDDNVIVGKQLARLNVWGECSGFMIAGEAGNGQSALNKLRSEKYDLVITDIRMPKVDGIELLIKVTEENLASCVVLMSEFSEFRYAKQGLVYGAFDYLVKPVEAQDILALLTRVKQKLLSQQKEQPRLPEFAVQTTDWLPSHEVELMKRYLREKSSQVVDMAEIVSDLIISRYADKPIWVSSLLREILQDLIAGVIIHHFWIEKYVELHDLPERLVETTQDVQRIKQLFIQTTEDLYHIVEKFSPIEGQGPLVREVTRYILENIDGKTSTQELASALYISRTYMSEVFREKSGMTLNEYLTGMKMERAKKLLTKPDIKLNEVAEQVGYHDVSYFGRLFIAHAGMSISEFRDRFQVGHDSNSDNIRHITDK